MKYVNVLLESRIEDFFVFELFQIQINCLFLFSYYIFSTEIRSRELRISREIRSTYHVGAQLVVAVNYQ